MPFWRASAGQAQPYSQLVADDACGYLEWGDAWAVAEVEPADGEDDHERRMRVVCYVHLTRFLRMLLDRKDRMIASGARRCRPELLSGLIASIAWGGGSGGIEHPES
jgi:hypothetical protein